MKNNVYRLIVHNKRHFNWNKRIARQYASGINTRLATWFVRNTNIPRSQLFCLCVLCHQKEDYHPHQHNCCCSECYGEAQDNHPDEHDDPGAWGPQGEPCTDGCCDECGDACLERAEKVAEGCYDVRFTEFADGLVLESKWVRVSARYTDLENNHSVLVQPNLE